MEGSLQRPLCFDLMDVFRGPNALEHGDRKSTTEVLAEFFEACQEHVAIYLVEIIELKPDVGQKLN